jgi:ribosomal protein S18 acetylase RimI-like enzyme
MENIQYIIRNYKPTDKDMCEKLEMQVLKRVIDFNNINFIKQHGYFNEKLSFILYDIVKKYIFGCILVSSQNNKNYVSSLCIDRDYHRLGFGKLLLNTILDNDFIYLYVRESNKSAIALYESNGFQQLNNNNLFYEDGEKKLYMVKK